MRSKLKAWVIPLCIAILVVSIIAILPSNLTGGDLECDDFVKCKDGAGCKGPGDEHNCKLSCEKGPTVDCGTATFEW
ncbi:MAG: hypothetical protein GTN82_02765 [Candidatus Aminicenantes bacterium]|nr:hypothetical protein [Candidatus Aminicenantes bacterium]